MQGELVSLWQRAGFTALLVTHDVEEALFLAGRVIVLSQRPAHIKAEIANARPYPPTGATRIWPSFAIKCSRISVSTPPGKNRAGWAIGRISVKDHPLERGTLSAAGRPSFLVYVIHSAITSVPLGPLSNGFAIFVLHPPANLVAKLAETLRQRYSAYGTFLGKAATSTIV